jgi:hypothetical protein
MTKLRGMRCTWCVARRGDERCIQTLLSATEKGTHNMEEPCIGGKLILKGILKETSAIL